MEVIIVGIHSIAEALRNNDRIVRRLYATEEGLSELRKKGELKKEFLDRVQVKLFSPHKLQEEAKSEYKRLDFHYTRVPSGVFLLAEDLEDEDFSWVMNEMTKKENLRILCLDQVTDVHNAAAIMRTACFYGVDAIIVSTKGNFGKAPSFSRIASGALEHVKIVKCASLPKTITKLQKAGFTCVGFSEHEKNEAKELPNENLCLVLGAEDVGLSNAVMRSLDKVVAFKTKGAIKSLNVSVAAAVAMEKFFTV
ncbi:RNA methyltransferase [Halobacteriovorax sp. GB3]|uniref:TrmH family RNA methyltransferase n=1 Tax=Halobacteriovorax sp. GB3 TaxID=2719615 RepID=UPI00235FE3B6|nr:RNA methyltransferase [Halobacteriovorax sp. GB3]MDD0854843.1 RNA methyltransferase [Halobacteriovorax sp. GB3]